MSWKMINMGRFFIPRTSIGIAALISSGMLMSSSPMQGEGMGISEDEKKRFNKIAKEFIKLELNEERKKGGTEEWEKEKSGCSFCQHFLESPCKSPFTWWSKCVDKSKEAGLDYVNTCGEYTDALMACTSEHAAYFEDEAEKAKSKEKDKDK